MKNDLARAYNLGADFTYHLINVSENQTFRIDSDDKKFALRLARPRYHTKKELESEIAWLEAITSIKTANPLRGYNGEYVQQVAGHQAVLFEWIEGSEPKISDNLMSVAEQLGSIAAHLHEHALNWQKPVNFTRPKWDFATTLGQEMRWGDWRGGLGVEPSMLPTLSHTVAQIESRLNRYGQSPQQFNLIHGDLRLANLIQCGSKLTVIDFDDCGFGWLMYDGATLISFHEHQPQAKGMIQNWIAGYRKVKTLSAEDEAIIPTMIMLRRILLLAWLGSHKEIELAKQVAADFAKQTIVICENYLTRGEVF